MIRIHNLNIIGILAFFVLIFATRAERYSIGKLEQTIPTELFDPNYLEGDSNYHSLNAASDGMLYFTIGTHHTDSSARIFRFDPSEESITLLGDLGDILDDGVGKRVRHGKIHTPLIEHEGFLYFSTHTSNYEGSLPNMNPEGGRAPYPGGHFMRYDLKNDVFEDLVQLKLSNEGIITMAVDKKSDTLFGLTWPTGLLVSYNIRQGLLQNWGAVQGRGEWGHLPDEWNFICRRLGIDDEGNVYGGTDTGRIWRFEAGKQRPVSYLENLSLNQLPPIQDANFKAPNETHFFWKNWRTILWNPDTESFWGIQGGSTQLFEFDPSAGTLRSVGSIRAKNVDRHTRRNPYRSQLGFMLGPKNTLIYLAHGPPIPLEGRFDVNSSVHLITYKIDKGEYRDHGMLVAKKGRRIFHTESIAIGADDHLYTVAWVESVDPKRMKEIQVARAKAAPEETNEAIYEMQLVRLPTWQTFID